jgi:hypothetical protein
MPKSNKTQVNIRLTPPAKKAAYKLAKEQKRTVSATIEVLILAAAEQREGVKE